MKMRVKQTGEIVHSSRFNVHSLSEVLTGDDSFDMRDLDVFVNDQWKDLRQAFADRDIIPDNYNSYFGEPENEEDRNRGYFL